MFFVLVLFVTFFYLDSSSQEIITIEIDGSNLPNDIGTWSKGKEIYLKNCSNCHGYSGEGYMDLNWLEDQHLMKKTSLKL